MTCRQEIEAESKPAIADEEARVGKRADLPSRDDALAIMERIQSHSLATVLEVLFGNAQENQS